MMESEYADTAVFFSLGGVGLSLINSMAEEVAFVTLSKSAALWEVEVRNKWKTLNMELASLLEQKWLHDENSVILEDYLEADLDKMEMKKPFMGSLRRTYNPALWAQYRKSKHHTYLHAKVHRLQVDNQLKDAYFSTVFSPIPLPSYILKRSGPRPFIEFALMRRQVPEKDIDTFKYVKLIIQEFNVKLDKGFVLSVYDVFDWNSEKKDESEQLQADLTQIHKSLYDMTVLYMHISFSLDGRVHKVNNIDTSF
ncbi:hypothetical protein LSH36_573g05026, partial [Paralvinella palmiformis]